MGFFPDLFAANPRVLADPTGRRWYDMIQSGQGAQAAFDIIQVFSSGSCFIGYEWTSDTGGNNLHRNVIYRGGASHALQMEPMVPIRPYGSDDPRDLRTWLETYEERTGGNVLAIAHNGNLSGGMMFPLIEPVDGAPLPAGYAETRARWEPIYEVTQMKGEDATRPFAYARAAALLRMPLRTLAAALLAGAIAVAAGLAVDVPPGPRGPGLSAPSAALGLALAALLVWGFVDLARRRLGPVAGAVAASWVAAVGILAAALPA